MGNGHGNYYILIGYILGFVGKQGIDSIGII